MLFNEPKLLKLRWTRHKLRNDARFSALQRAEIAEMYERVLPQIFEPDGFSALQRAEIAEIATSSRSRAAISGFSALQRAEIAEMPVTAGRCSLYAIVSVLFNEPKLLKCRAASCGAARGAGFSALQRAEIAEIRRRGCLASRRTLFQCSSTSRNC